MINGILKNREKFNTTDKYTQKENLYFQSNSNKKAKDLCLYQRSKPNQDDYSTPERERGYQEPGTEFL